MAAAWILMLVLIQSSESLADTTGYFQRITLIVLNFCFDTYSVSVLGSTPDCS